MFYAEVSKKCVAEAYSDLPPANPVLKTDHNHCPEPVKLEVDRHCTEMHIRAAASNKAVLLSVDTCKHSIARNRTHEYPAKPASMVNLHIVPPWTHTLGQQQEEFLFFDNKQHTESLPAQQRIISAAWLLQISGRWLETSQWLHRNAYSST